jgi:cystathionine beta-lyase/cystathionine gamma-synthase
MGFTTRQIHAGVTPDPTTGAILTPIYQSTTFVQDSVDEYLDKGYSYSRSGNPTVKALEAKLADLEGGVDCSCFGTGMGATTATMLAFLDAGKHAIVSDVAYGGTYRLATKVLSRFGIEFTFADTANADDVAAAVRDNTAMIFTETPANPTMKCSDIAAISKIAKGAGAVHVVDNTLLTPYYQLPLELGADVSVHSTTKYMDGHNATVGGAAISKTEEHAAAIRFIQNSTGSIMSPQVAWLTSQGCKTMSLRMDQQSANAMAIASFLESQMDNVEVWTLAENLGSVESLITHPVTMTHADVEEAERQRVGIIDGLVRLSVGLEDAEDLIGALDKALASV